MSTLETKSKISKAREMAVTARKYLERSRQLAEANCIRYIKAEFEEGTDALDIMKGLAAMWELNIETAARLVMEAMREIIESEEDRGCEDL